MRTRGVQDFRRLELLLTEHLAAQGFQLAEALPGAAVRPNTWTSMASSHGEAAGRLQLRLDTAVAAIRIAELLCQRAIQVGGDMVSLSVQEESQLAVQAIKNCRRRDNCRTAPSA